MKLYGNGIKSYGKDLTVSRAVGKYLFSGRAGRKEEHAPVAMNLIKSGMDKWRCSSFSLSDDWTTNSRILIEKARRRC